MGTLEEEDYPAIKFGVTAFDRSNALLSFVFDHSIGAPYIDLPIIEGDMTDAYFDSIRLLRTEAGLAKFIRQCGQIVVDGQITRGRVYQSALDYAVVDQEDETMSDQLDDVIKRFATHQTEFDTLYGNVFARRRKSPTPEVVQPAPVIEDPRVIARQRAQEAARQQRLAEQQILNFTARLQAFTQAQIDATPDGLLEAKHVSVAMQDQLPDLTRDQARLALTNVIDDKSVFRAGSRNGYAVLSTQKVDTAKGKTINQPVETPEKPTNALLPHELQLAKKIIAEVHSAGNRDKGLTTKALAARLALDEDEVKAITSKVLKQGVMTSELRKRRTGAQSSKKHTATFIVFPTQADFTLFKAEPEEFYKRLKAS